VVVSVAAGGAKAVAARVVVEMEEVARVEVRVTEEMGVGEMEGVTVEEAKGEVVMVAVEKVAAGWAEVVMVVAVMVVEKAAAGKAAVATAVEVMAVAVMVGEREAAGKEVVVMVAEGTEKRKERIHGFLQY
jgi:hypothetical protein